MHRRKKRSRINPVLILASVLIFMTGAGIFVYPAVSNYLAERRQAEAVRDYQRDVSSLEPQDLSEQKARAQEYNKNLAEDEFHDPFLQDGKYVISPAYQKVLDYNEEGIMGYVEIPDIDVNLPIYHGTGEEALRKGAGHLEASSLPIGGEGTHSVISAHRGLPSAKLFSDLDELEIGDVFFIHILNETHAYQVDQINVVKPDELDILRVVNGQDLVTLLTCTPYAVNTHRLLVRGVRIPYEEAESVREAVGGGNPLSGWVKEYAASVLAGLALLVLLTLSAIAWKRRKDPGVGRLRSKDPVKTKPGRIERGHRKREQKRRKYRE